MKHLEDFNPQNAKFEPGRTVWILLHEDRTHIYPRPDGEPAWSYNKSELKITKAVLCKDLGIFDYHICELSVAWPLLCNKQGELEEMWDHTMKKIRKAKTSKGRRDIYRLFYTRRREPHPIRFDAELKRLLKIE